MHFVPVNRVRLGGFALLIMSGWVIAGYVPDLLAAESGEAAPPFALKERGTGREVKLADFSGKIVVLDFFAHWCVPCLRCSEEIETGIRKWYAKGNRQGVPAEVLGINIEAARPDRTDAFIKRTGMATVLEDPGGEVFRQYRGEALPLLVIIDATAMTSDKPARIVYREAGFPGLGPLRKAIDDIVPPSSATRAPLAPTPGTVSKPTTAPTNSVPSAPEMVTAARTNPAPTTPPAERTLQTAIATNPPGKELQPQLLAPPAEEQPAGSKPLSMAGAHAPTSWLSDLDFSCLWASDILLTDETLELRQTRPEFEAGLSLTHGHIGENYMPESPLEKPAALSEERFGFQVHGKAEANRRLWLLGGGGAYYGYMDYRTLWFNEHFTQLYSRRPEYQKAHPWGYNASGGCRWEYLPASGFVQGDLVWQQDVIAPGYEVELTFPPRLVRFRDTYDSLTGRATFENVFTPWLRAQQIVQVIDTTDRQLRVALESDANFALGESWVLRLALAGAKEEPQFESWSVGATLERDWNETWFVSLTCRYYQDTGEIENALLPENTAGPPLKAVQAGVGLRWQHAGTSVKLILGPYFTRYEQVGTALRTFQNLYQNRDWFSAQLAFAHEF